MPNQHLMMNREKTDIEKSAVVDGHAHLEQLEDLEGALRAAKEAQMKGVVGVGVDRVSSERILGIANANPDFVYPDIGYHSLHNGVRCQHSTALLSICKACSPLSYAQIVEC